MRGPGNKRTLLQSWIPPRFASTSSPDCFFIEVPLDDSDIVEFISKGVCSVRILNKKVLSFQAKLPGGQSLRDQLERTVRAPAKLKQASTRIKLRDEVKAHCCGVFLLDKKTLCVMVGWANAVSSDIWLTPALKTEVDALLSKHESEIKNLDEAIEHKKQKIDASYEAKAGIKKLKEFEDFQLAQERVYARPVLSAKRLVPLLPRAAKFTMPRLGEQDKIIRSAIAAIAASGLLLPRDGNYSIVLPRVTGRRPKALVTWVPHTGLPSYPEESWP